jgi:hypothetical protein
VTDDDDVHALVPQLAWLTTPEVDRSAVPKLRPVTVTYIPALLGLFCCSFEYTGASNEKMRVAVPAAAATVTIMLWSFNNLPNRDNAVTSDVEHVIVVDEDHEAVAH